MIIGIKYYYSYVCCSTCKNCGSICGHDTELVTDKCTGCASDLDYKLAGISDKQRILMEKEANTGHLRDSTTWKKLSDYNKKNVIKHDSKENKFIDNKDNTLIDNKNNVISDNKNIYKDNIDINVINKYISLVKDKPEKIKIKYAHFIGETLMEMYNKSHTTYKGNTDQDL